MVSAAAVLAGGGGGAWRETPAGAGKPPTPATWAVLLEVVLLGNTPHDMAAADSIIQFLRPLSDQLCILQTFASGHLNMQGAFVLRTSGPSLEEIITLLDAKLPGLQSAFPTAKLPALQSFPTPAKIQLSPSRQWPGLFHHLKSSGWQVVLEGGKRVRDDRGTAAGTGFSVLDACDAVLNGEFRKHHLSVEQEKVGKQDASGKLVLRTWSYLLVPLMCAAIVGIENSTTYFPAFPASVYGFGRDFAFEEVVSAVRTILNGRNMPIHIQSNPNGNRTLYFDRLLQDEVIAAMESQFTELWLSMQKWIQTRFEREVEEHNANQHGVCVQ